MRGSPVLTRPSRSPAAARSVALVALATLAVVTAGCNDDGRTLRPARPDQVGSVSTIAEVTTTVPEPSFDEPSDGGIETTPSFDIPSGSDDIGGDPFDTADLPVVGSDDTAAEAVLTAPFAQDTPIDPLFTCAGDNDSPPLSWTAAPAGTLEIAISMVDNDNPGFVHWVMAGLDPATTSLAESEVPPGAIVGLNTPGGQGYYGPCPPVGATAHHYVFTVHFLGQRTELTTGATGTDLLAAVDGATFLGASVVGTYART